MADRCPQARPVGTALLPGWRFLINTRGSAGIIRARDAVTHGVLWRVSPSCLATLDGFEGVPARRYRRQRVIIDVDGDRRPAITYVSANTAPGVPRRFYHDAKILTAAQDWALDPVYFDELAAWVPASPRAMRVRYAPARRTYPRQSRRRGKPSRKCRGPALSEVSE